MLVLSHVVGRELGMFVSLGGVGGGELGRVGKRVTAGGVGCCGLVLARLELGLELGQSIVRSLTWKKVKFFKLFFRSG